MPSSFFDDPRMLAPRQTRRTDLGGGVEGVALDDGAGAGQHDPRAGGPGHAAEAALDDPMLITGEHDAPVFDEPEGGPLPDAPSAPGFSVTLIPVLMGYLIRGRIPAENANPINWCPKQMPKVGMPVSINSAAAAIA